jgi:hypothetical protein
MRSAEARMATLYISNARSQPNQHRDGLAQWKEGYPLPNRREVLPKAVAALLGPSCLKTFAYADDMYT